MVNVIRWLGNGARVSAESGPRREQGYSYSGREQTGRQLPVHMHFNTLSETTFSSRHYLGLTLNLSRSLPGLLYFILLLTLLYF